MGWVDDEQTPALYADKTPVRQLGSRSPSGVARAADFNAIKQALIDVREWLRDPANQGVSEAADVAFAPAGAISSTNVQAALEELDGIISFLGALVGGVDSALTAHTTDTSVHGTAGDVVGTTDTQTLSNKTHSGTFTVTDVTAGNDALVIPSGGVLRLGPGTQHIYSAGGFLFTPSAFQAGGYIASQINAPAGSNLTLLSKVASGATALALRITSESPLTDTGAKLVQVENGGTAKAFFDKDGGLSITGVASGADALTIPSGGRIKSGGKVFYFDGYKWTTDAPEGFYAGEITAVTLRAQGRVMLSARAVSGLGSAASAQVGSIFFCTDGDAGQPCLAVSDGTNWRRIPLGAPVSTS